MTQPIAVPPAGGEGPGPGSRLRREREKRGISPVEAAEQLRLDTSVIEALEGDRFASIGPAVYAKGHLKQYAALLGLPAAEILSGYEAVQRAAGSRARVDQAHASVASADIAADRSSADGAAHATPFPKVPARHQLPTPARFPAWTLPAGSAAGVLLLAAGLLVWWKPWQHRAPPLAQDSQGAAISASPADEDLVSGPAASAPGPSAGALPVQAANSVARAGRVRLRMSFSADSWVDVRDATGANVFRGRGAANSVKTLSGAAPLTVYLGYVSGVQLEINNHAVAIGPQLVRGDVARFEAGADGVLRRVPRP